MDDRLTQARDAKKDAKTALKKDLAAAFPGVKFSMRIKNYDTLYLAWMEGPTVREVNAIAEKYVYGHFNAMEDIYEITNRDPLAVFKYAFADREFSDGFMAVLREYASKFFKAGDYEIHRFEHRVRFDISVPVGAVVKGFKSGSAATYEAIF